MSKYGFNPKELRKTIVTQIDKDGFHNRTVTYGKDSGGSESSDWSTATITFQNDTSTPFEFRYPVTYSTSSGGQLRKAAQDETTRRHGVGLYIDNAGTYKNGMSTIVETILYKGALMVPFWVMIRSDTFAGDFFSSFKLDLSENVRLVESDDDDYFCITGDCEITIKDHDDNPQ